MPMQDLSFHPSSEIAKKQGFPTIEAAEDVGTGCRQVMIECPR